VAADSVQYRQQNHVNLSGAIPLSYAMGVWGYFPQGIGTAEEGVDVISHLHLFLV
jgi:hypothetical protein